MAILRVGPRIGGVTAGAFDAAGALVGFVFGLTGVERDGRRVHWSDMLAVRRDARGRGIGRRLKEHQRKVVRGLGVEVIYWTFDPLVARNAHLNLTRLGARVREYVPDMYGTTDSPLHGALETDRFVVAWDVEGRGDDGLSPDPGLSTDTGLPPLVNPGAGGGEVDLAGARAGAPAVRVRIPCDIQAVQEASLEEARAWRYRTRDAFTRLLELGYRVVGFQRSAGKVPDDPGSAGKAPDDPGSAGTGPGVPGSVEDPEGCWYLLALPVAAPPPPEACPP